MSKFVAVAYDYLSCPQRHSTILGIYDTKEEAQQKIDDHKMIFDQDPDIYDTGIEVFETSNEMTLYDMFVALVEHTKDCQGQCDQCIKIDQYISDSPVLTFIG